MIRRANQEDKQAIWRVHTAAIREQCKHHYTPQQIQAWTSFLSPESYREVIETRSFFVAEDDGSIVGFGQLNLETGEIEAVYVSPQRARQGWGKSLLQTLEDVARAKGLNSLHLCASLNAVGFYEKAEYTSQDEFVHRLPDGTELACVHMEKHFN